MALKKYEIDAITSKVIDAIKDRMQVPDFTKELEERRKLHSKYKKLSDEYAKLNKELESLYNEEYHPAYTVKPGNLTDYNYDNYLKILIGRYHNNHLPNRFEIERDLILENTKDLAALVDKLIEKYASKN
jgi:hypothetical protein